jgi:O-antigen/teichoic acid export membrane protein
MDGPLRESVLDARRLLRNGAAHVLGFGLPTLLGLLLVPFMITYLGIDGFGIFVTFAAVGAFAAAFDGGLFWSFLREVASVGDGRRLPHSHASAVATSFLTLAAGRGLLTATVGWWAARALGTDGGLSGAEHILALCFGAAAFFEAVDAFGAAVLQGRNRFGLVNTIEVVTMVARTAGTIGLLTFGGGIVAAATWHATTVAAGAAATLHYAAVEGVPFRPGSWRWAEMKRHLHFGIAVQADQLVGRIAGPGGILLVGHFLGAPGAAAYNIAYRIPGATLNAVARLADVFFPAASISIDDPAEKERHGKALLDFGGRVAMLLVVPLSGPLLVLAGPLLTAWVGDVATPEVISLTRLLAMAAVVSAVGLVPMSVLWGRSAVGSILLINLGYLGVFLALAALLLPRYGLLAAGWTMLAVAATTGGAAFARAHRLVGSTGVFRQALRIIAGPGAVLACSAAVTAWTFASLQRGGLSALAVAGGAGAAIAICSLMLLPGWRVALGRSVTTGSTPTRALPLDTAT